MGSTSDWDVMSDAAATLAQFGVEFEKRVVSAHRTPDLLVEYAKTAKSRGLEVIIAGAGGAAILSETQFFYNGTITFDVDFLQIIEQTTAFTNQHFQGSFGRIIFVI